MVLKNKGFTLVELLIVMTILMILMVMAVGILNPVALVNKGKDAQRKKDLKTIKIAFEEYFNDKGQFPPDVADWNISENCGKNIEKFPYLNFWPCDPNGEPYKILVETIPNRFRVITNLENKKDKNIPDGWYLKGDNYKLFNWTINDVNYGVSSTNILWYDKIVRDYSKCYVSVDACFDGNDGCEHVSNDVGCEGNCFYQSTTDGGCVDDCWISCCGDGCPPN